MSKQTAKTNTAKANKAAATTNTEQQVEKPVFRVNTSRSAAQALFNQMLPQRSTLGNTEFRKGVIAKLMETQKMTLASAAATYNIIKKHAVATGVCEDFGRTPAAPKAPAEPKAKGKGKAKAEAPAAEATA